MLKIVVKKSETNKELAKEFDTNVKKFKIPKEFEASATFLTH